MKCPNDQDEIREDGDDLKNLHEEKSLSTKNPSEIIEEKQSTSTKSENISKESSSSASSTKSGTSSKSSNSQIQPGDYQQKIHLEANLTEQPVPQNKTAVEDSKKETQILF